MQEGTQGGELGLLGNVFFSYDSKNHLQCVPDGALWLLLRRVVFLQLYTVVQHVKHFNDVVESGENQEFTDDFEYLETGLKSSQPLNTRCLRYQACSCCCVTCCVTRRMCISLGKRKPAC